MRAEDGAGIADCVEDVENVQTVQSVKRKMSDE